MTQEVVIFPDAADVVIEWLRPQLVVYGMTTGVYSRVPSPRPTRFVLVRRQGGTSHDRIFDAATLTVECWAGNESTAMDLAQLCRGLVHAMQSTVQGGVVIYKVDEFAGPALLPDPESDSPRVTFTMQVQTRGEAA